MIASLSTLINSYRKSGRDYTTYKQIRRKLLAFKDLLEDCEVKDFVSHLSWTNYHILSEIFYLRNRSSMSEYPGVIYSNSTECDGCQ